LNRLRFPRALDALWLLLLSIYILAGMMQTAFHGDEAMQIYMSHDYATAFIERDPARLMVAPPYNIDEDSWLRILNGSINRYAIGLSWQLAGLNTGMLPPRPGWDWGLDYDSNVQTGHRPSEALLAAGRISSTLFLAASAVVIFVLGEQFGGRPLAYLVSALYTLNPVILLNGRRAMMEGSLLFFGLLAVLIAVHISRGWRSWLGFILLGLCSGFALASKHSAAVFVAGAFGWILFTSILDAFKTPIETQPVSPAFPESSSPSPRWRRGWEMRLIFILKLTLSALLTVVLFVGLSPALWNDPIARLGDLVAQRQMLLDIQVAVAGGNATTLLERIGAIITQPFMTPPQQFEVTFWAGIPVINEEINRYMASPLSGLQFGVLLGGLLTLLSGIGIIVTVRNWRSWQIGSLIWLAVTIASLLINPLPWQRYYLPLIPIVTLLAGIGLFALINRYPKQQKEHP